MVLKQRDKWNLSEGDTEDGASATGGVTLTFKEFPGSTDGKTWLWRTAPPVTSGLCDSCQLSLDGTRVASLGSASPVLLCQPSVQHLLGPLPRTCPRHPDHAVAYFPQCPRVCVTAAQLLLPRGFWLLCRSFRAGRYQVFWRCCDSDTGQMKRLYSIVKKMTKTWLKVYRDGERGWIQEILCK